jgi:hypothetical protein
VRGKLIRIDLLTEWRNLFATEAVRQNAIYRAAAVAA